MHEHDGPTTKSMHVLRVRSHCWFGARPNISSRATALFARTCRLTTGQLEHESLSCAKAIQPLPLTLTMPNAAITTHMDHRQRQNSFRAFNENEQDPPSAPVLTPPYEKVLCYKCGGDFLASTCACVTSDDFVIYSYTLCTRHMLFPHIAIM